MPGDVISTTQPGPLPPMFWPPIDPDDTEGFARMQEIAPFFTLNKAKVGATIDGTDGYQGAGYAYPVLTSIAATDEALVYNMTKAMVELFPKYDGNSPGIGGWALDKQNMEWVVPYHEGAIRYFEEVGAWSDTAQAHNDKLVKRQEALAAAWEATKASNPSDWEAAGLDLSDGGLLVLLELERSELLLDLLALRRLGRLENLGRRRHHRGIVRHGGEALSSHRQL